MQFEIKEIWPHKGFHFDEAVAGVLARRYGGERFKDIANAKVVPGTLSGSELENLMAGRLPLGQLRGMFDDKDETGRRIPDTCCAKRMAEFIGVTDRSELQKLLKAVLRVDGTATASPTDISSVIKTILESLPEQLHPSIFEWTETAIGVIIDYQSIENPSKVDNYIKPLAVFQQMIDDKSVENPRVIERMTRLLASSEKQTGNCIEIASIAHAMKVLGVSDGQVTDWLYTGIQKWAQQMEEYWSAIDEIRRAGQSFDILPRYPGDRLKGLFIASDNPQVAKASRSRGMEYAVCIVRRPSKRNVSIVPNGYAELDMTRVWALIRLEETDCSNRLHADIDELVQEGNHHMAPNWHMMQGGIAMNGSRFIEAHPTRLTDKTLVNIVRIGFSTEAENRIGLLTGRPIRRLPGQERFNGRLKKPVKSEKSAKAASVQTNVSTDLSYQTRKDLEATFDLGLQS